MTAERYDDMVLPSQIPIFPLPNALLLPEGQLPLNIFEPRYLAMIDDALGAPGRLIGMVQPVDEAGALFGIGCAGRISYFQETGDGRYMIALNGVCRFRLAGHHLTERGYRLADISWDEFMSDLADGEGGIADRDHMFAVMRRYFDTQGFEADWDQIERSDDSAILNTLAMVCPFDVAEKQALLEAKGVRSRADLLIAMMEMALHGDEGQNDARH
ncbi:MAG: LON peptidase substrate-binding domain-containing protein [Pseudomonadota bacterium]|nr:LON peptidase substrate-binding domain-containing protein [Pseudomonadota bacterium]